MEEEKINISSIDFNSIVQLRRALHRIGVNSSTPGLTGTKRMRELGNRLRAAISNEKEEEEEEEEDFGEWNNKSMMELRQELIRRGIDTSTHGVTGHDRRRCLMKRLQSSRKEIRPAPSIGLWRKTTTTKDDDLILDTVKKVSYNDDESSSSTWTVPKQRHHKTIHNFTSDNENEIEETHRHYNILLDRLERIEKTRRDAVQEYLGLGGGEKKNLSKTASLAVALRSRLKVVSAELNRVLQFRKRFVDSAVLSEDGTQVQRFHRDVIQHRLEELKDDLSSRLAILRSRVLDAAQRNETYGTERQYEIEEEIEEMKRALVVLQRRRVQEMQVRERHEREIERKKLESRVVKRIQRMALDETSSSSSSKVSNHGTVEKTADFDQLRAQVSRWRRNFDKIKRSSTTSSSSSSFEHNHHQYQQQNNNNNNDPLAATPLKRTVSDTSREVSNIITSNATTRAFLWNVPPPSHAKRVRAEQPLRVMGQDAIVMLSVHKNASAAERILREAMSLDSTNAFNILRLASILRDAPSAKERILEISNLYKSAIDVSTSVVVKGQAFCEYAVMKRVVCNDCDASVKLCERGLKIHKSGILLREYAIAMLGKWEKSRLRRVPPSRRHRDDDNESNRHGENEEKKEDVKNVDEIELVNETLMNAIFAMPDCPDLLCRLAHFKHKYLNDLVSAQKYYYHATIVSPCSASSHSNFASFLARTRKESTNPEKHARRAELYYVRGLKMDPNHVNCLGNFSTFLWRVRGEMEKAEALLDRAIHLDDTHINNLCKMASLLKKLGKYDRCERTFLRVLNLSPRNANVLGNFANFLRKVRGEYDRAKDMYLRALDINPYHHMNRRNYALLLRDHPELRSGSVRSVSRGEIGSDSGK